MPRRRVSSPADEEMEEQANAEQEHGPRLQFKQPLSWKAGKPIAVAELLKRLEALSRELQSYDQDDGVARDSMLTVAAELASQQLLSHKDKGVRAYTACCLVDIFKLCAPDAPLSAKELKDIFNLIVHTVIPSLADPSSTYNGQHLYVLKSLAEVKSIVLLADVPGTGPLVELLFKQCFDVLGGPTKSNSGEELSKNVEHHMTSVLSTVVEESQNLSTEVVETILAQFLRTSPKVAANGIGKGKKAAQVEESQGTLTLKEAPPAYNMATNVCNSSPDKMGRYVTRYVNAILLEASSVIAEGSTTTATKKGGKKRASDEIDDSDDDVKSSAADLGPTRKAHELLRELWRSTPSILQELIPQHLETELTAENVQLRLLAVETVADMISGIGHAGPPPPTALNPAAYPSQSLLGPADKKSEYNFLTTPSSPVSFVSRYFQTYQVFVSRKGDPSPAIRAAWATAIGRILSTSAGGVGLDAEEEKKLLSYFADSLVDQDEKVRFNAVKAVERFDFDDIVAKLGSRGGISDSGSIFSNLAQRVKDKKQHVRNESIRLLAKIWGVAAGAIGDGSDRVSKLLGPIPSVILEAYYVNDPDINALVDRVLYESLLPLPYPPVKAKAQANGNSQRVKDSQAASEEPDPDQIRTERILLLIRDLEQRAKSVLFSIQIKQKEYGTIITGFLKSCEDYNGGVMDKDEKDTKQRLGKFIAFLSKQLPDSSKVSDDLWKFAKMHDRRSYQLIRFCMAADSDYRKVQKSIRELTKRIEEATSSTATLLDTITILVFRCSNLLYNRSHVPAIIDFSRTDENGLGSTAHEVLKEISKNKPEVFKAHVQDLCKSLEAESPTAKKPNGPNAVDDLKACAQFARQFPKDVPKERKFLQAMLGFVSHGVPPKAAKYGVLIIMTTADKKEMYAKDIFKQCTQGFTYGSGNYLARLAALSQLMLLGPQYLEEAETDVVVDIAINQVLTNPDATPEPDELDPSWLDEPDDNCAAKIWALKILANRLRGYAIDDPVIDDASKPVFQFLNTLVQKHGQITTKRPSLAAHQSRLRLVASQLLLKLCCEKRFNQRLTPTAFNSLSTVAMDSNEHVRSGFVNMIMKYLGQGKLSFRFYTPLFLLGHEVVPSIREKATTWLRSRAAYYAKQKDTPMEGIFARLLSLLAHHPDWLSSPSSPAEEKSNDLRTFMGYIIFYLKCVATRENISLIYHVSQRVKAVQDGITTTDKKQLAVMNERLWSLSDLSQEVAQAYGDAMGWNLQAWPGKVAMPAGIFVAMPGHEMAQSVAMKSFLPEDLTKDIDVLVKDALRSKKRKHDNQDARTKKRAKAALTSSGAEKRLRKSAKPSLKTPKKKSGRAGSHFSSDAGAPSSEPSRRSARGANQKSYIEVSDDEDSAENVDAEDEDEEMEDVDEEEEEEQAEEDLASPPQKSSSRLKNSTATKTTPKKINDMATAKSTPAKSTPLASSSAKKVNGHGTPAKTEAKSKAKAPAAGTTRSSRAKRGAPAEEVEEEAEEVVAPPKAAKGSATSKGKAAGKAKAKKEVWDVSESD